MSRNQPDGPVCYDHRHIPGLAHRTVVQPGHSGSALDDRIVGWLAAVAAILAEPEHSAADDSRIDLTYILVAQLEPGHRRGTDVPDHDVGVRKQLEERLMSFLLLEVQSNAAFVPVEMQEFSRHALGDAAPCKPAHRVP